MRRTQSQMERLQFDGQVFKSQDFSKQSLAAHILTDCLFQNCNLSLVKVDDCRLHNVQFIDCKIVGVEFFKCEKRFFSVDFRNCQLNYCNFSDLNMKNTHFCKSQIKEGYFTNTSLINARFENVDLSGTIFHNCNLSKADFSTAFNYHIDPMTNNIKKAKFSLPEAVGLLQGFDIILS